MGRTKKDRCCGNQGRWISKGVIRGPDTQKDTNELSDDFRRGTLSKTGNKSRLQKAQLTLRIQHNDNYSKCFHMLTDFIFTTTRRGEYYYCPQAFWL